MKVPGKRRPYARSFPSRPPLWRVTLDDGSIVHVEANDSAAAQTAALYTLRSLYGRVTCKVTSTEQMTKLHIKGSDTTTDKETKR